MREITEHHLDGRPDKVRLYADMPGPGGVDHHYTLVTDQREQVLQFQFGPASTSGANGATEEAVTAMLLDRFRGFRDGPYGCEQHDRIIAHLAGALEVMHERTREREQRGVEGLNVQ